MSRYRELDGIEVDYRRHHGVHHYDLADGTPVTSLSYPTWEEFEIVLGSLPSTSGYITSPELITATVPLEDMPQMQAEIEARVKHVQQISLDHPEATVLLGSANVDEFGIPRNSLVVINGGKIEGHFDKRGSMWPPERRVFSRTDRPQAILRSAGHSALVCSDIGSAGRWGINASPEFNLVGAAKESVLVGSCWAYPVAEMFPGMRPSGDGKGDGRYRPPLEDSIVALFQSHTDIKEVVMTDRTIPGVSNTPPYNAHFTRVS
jgi:hypothetical protein